MRNSLNIKVIFYDCDAGWIHLDMIFGKETIDIRLTNIWDPIPDIIQWLEDIAEDVPDAQVVINEEGRLVKLCSKNQERENILLNIYRYFYIDDESQISETNFDEKKEFILNKKDFIQTFYSGFLDFINSNNYNPYEWEYERISDQIFKRFHLKEDIALKIISNLKREEIELFLKNIEIDYYKERNSEIIPKLELNEYLNFCLRPENLLDREYDNYNWYIDEEFTDMKNEEKVLYLMEYFKEGINSWSGSRLRELDLRKIEKYLSGEKDVSKKSKNQII